ncbi:hypothetical protein BH09PLA1_BH09PLA1_31600 [soil metagenome]
MDKLQSPPDERPPADPSAGADVRLSYKFQRLRERLRAAITSGELTGKLPGERQLARRFRVNAKTLSKALTDLAAEGLLERSIGRGTFVKGSEPQGAAAAATGHADRWLILCAPQQQNSPLVRTLREMNPSAQVAHDTSTLRPSFLSHITAVIDLNPDTPQAFLRDLIVRSASVVLVGREPTNYSLNAVLVDRTLGASLLARDLMLDGHRRFVAVERRGSTQVADAIRAAARRYAPDASVDVAFASEAAGAVEGGATAVICDSAESAREVRIALDRLGVATPNRASIAAVGTADADAPCSGYFVSPQQKADAIVQVIRDTAARKPSTLWLTGAHVNAGTTGPTEAMIDPAVRFRCTSATQ